MLGVRRPVRIALDTALSAECRRCSTLCAMQSTHSAEHSVCTHTQTLLCLESADTPLLADCAETALSADNALCAMQSVDHSVCTHTHRHYSARRVQPRLWLQNEDAPCSICRESHLHSADRIPSCLYSAERVTSCLQTLLCVSAECRCDASMSAERRRDVTLPAECRCDANMSAECRCNANRPAECQHQSLCRG